MMSAKNTSITPVRSLCILRLSALGDITHALPIFYTIRLAWPETKITWIIGKVEYELLKNLEGVEFIIFDKKAGLSEYKKIRAQLKNRHFDVLLHMQMSLRASLISLLIKAKTKVGFDRARAKDGQWLFTNKKIKPLKNQHVIDSFFGFTEALGIQEKKYQWDIPLTDENTLSTKQLLNHYSDYIVISPCSSKAYRNWHVSGYAEITDYIYKEYGYKIILTGGNSQVEQQYADEISSLCQCQPLNLVGKTRIPELLAIIKRAKFMISPDSGPAHMATAMHTPVIGLYACTNPDRARSYLSADWVVNRYPDAIRKKFNKTVNQVHWGTRVRDDWAMAMIKVNDVEDMIKKLFSAIQQNKI